MDFQNRAGGKTGGGGVASASDANRDRRERLRQLALETIDIAKDPYFMKNHLGSYECKLCLTLHNNEGSYLAHTQGKKHQSNLARRAAKEALDAPAQPAPEKVKVELRKFVKIGRPGYKVTKQREPESATIAAFPNRLSRNRRGRHPQTSLHVRLRTEDRTSRQEMAVPPLRVRAVRNHLLQAAESRSGQKRAQILDLLESRDEAVLPSIRLQVREQQKCPTTSQDRWPWWRKLRHGPSSSAVIDELSLIKFLNPILTLFSSPVFSSFRHESPSEMLV